MNNTCGVEDCNRLLRYRIEMLREILSAMRAGEEAREAMKFKGEEACYDPVNQADLSNLRFRKRIVSPITLRNIGMTAEQHSNLEDVRNWRRCGNHTNSVGCCSGSIRMDGSYGIRERYS
jgi:hypothetical protein